MNTRICGKIFAVMIAIITLIVIAVPQEVLAANSTEVKASGITLDKSNVTLGEFNEEKLFAKATPDNASNQVIEWQNSNPKAVAIDREIEEGTYYLISALDTKKVIDIKGSSKEDSAKVQLWNRNNSIAQRFHIYHDFDNSYCIESACSDDKQLSLKDGSKTKGTIVQQRHNGFLGDHRWYFEYAGNGFYYIKSRSSGLYLDVKGGKADNGTQIQVWTENRTNSQKFKLELVNKTLTNGTYYIKSALNENKVLDIKGASKENKAQVQLWKKNNSVAQRFNICTQTDYNSGDVNIYTTITSVCSEKEIEVAGGAKTKGTKIQQNEKVNADRQKWILEYAGNGYYYIKSKCNGLYLDVKGGKTDNGTPIQVWTSNKTNSQKFKLELIETYGAPIENGTYYIKTSLDTSKTASVENGSTANKAKVVITNNSKDISQQFEFIKTQKFYYIIRNKKTGKVLDVTGGNIAKGTKIQQYSLNGTDAQLWKLYSAGNDYYYIQSKSSGLYLDVTGGKATNGNQLQIWELNKGKAQKFKIEKINSNTTYNNSEHVTLKPKTQGTATITAKLANGKTAKCTVKVLPKNDVTNILFIGDSQTYYNRMPEKIFKPMAEKNNKKVNVETITATDKTLEWHYENREKRGVIREETTLAKTVKSKKWDYVVLQEEVETSHSNYNLMKTGVSNIVNYMRQNGSPDVQIIYNAVWMDISSLTPGERSESSGRPEITKSGGKIFELQQKANNNYYNLAKTSGLKGKIAYSGKAFIMCWQEANTSDIQLYRAKLKEWKNPAVKGSFLEAGCLYYTIFGGLNTVERENDITLDKVWNYVPGEIDEEHVIENDQLALWGMAVKAQVLEANEYEYFYYYGL